MLTFTQNTQNIQINTEKIFSTSLMIILLISFIAILNPLVSAQENLQRTFETQTFMEITPNPAGVNQAVTFFVFSSHEPSQVSGKPYFGWNFTVTVTTPSGDKWTRDLPMSLSTGYSYIGYTPTEIGTYSVQAHFPAVIVEYTSPGSGGFQIGNYSYLESYSGVKTLTVTEDPVLPWPNTPLPEGYWQFPITAENHLWSSLAGNWLYTSTRNTACSPVYYTTGPKTAHILWTKPISFGGLSGGMLWDETEDGLSYWTGLLYQKKFNPKIISGRLYYNTNPAGQNMPGLDCVDLRTGELIWSDPDFPVVDCAQVFTRIGGLGSGSQAFLWVDEGSTWYVYDAFNGQLLTQFEGELTGLSPVYGASGEILVYYYRPQQNFLALWNSSVAFLGKQEPGVRPSESWQPWNPAVRDWSDGIQWNVTIPDLPVNPSRRFVDYQEGVLVCSTYYDRYSDDPVFCFVGYDAITGEQIWQTDYSDVGWGQGGPINVGLMVFDFAIGEGYFSFFERETMEWHIIDIHTGREVAKTPPLNTVTGSDWSFYDWHPQIAYGKMYTIGYSGALCCFDLETGSSEWVFNQGSSGLETPYGTWPTYGTMTIGDGIVYVGWSQHTPATPMYKGYRLYAINATTGEEIWHIPFFSDPASLALAGGVLVNTNGYDNQIYAFGTGLSATTVLAPQTEILLGSSVLITGTVTDQSPGQTSLGIPAAGTPAIADAYQTEWMSYLYQQQPKPMNAEGVTVKLSYVDSNNNFFVMGETKSDINGQYTYTFTPTIPGLYTITATFDGTEAYYGSSSQTFMYVGEDLSSISTPVPTPTPESLTDTYIIGSTIAIIVAIAIVAFLLLRRK